MAKKAQTRKSRFDSKHNKQLGKHDMLNIRNIFQVSAFGGGKSTPPPF